MAHSPTGKRHKSITRRVSPEDVRGLLDSPPRANLAYVEGLRVHAVPVSFRYHEARYWFGVVDATGGLVTGAPVQLLIDDGEYMAELRGIAITGRVGERSEKAIDRPITWFEIVPNRVTAWDYAALRRKRL